MKKNSKTRRTPAQAATRSIPRIARRLTAAEALLEVVTDHVAALEREAIDRGARLTPLETSSTVHARRSRRRAA